MVDASIQFEWLRQRIQFGTSMSLIGGGVYSISYAVVLTWELSEGYGDGRNRQQKHTGKETGEKLNRN